MSRLDRIHAEVGSVIATVEDLARRLEGACPEAVRDVEAAVHSLTEAERTLAEAARVQKVHMRRQGEK